MRLFITPHREIYRITLKEQEEHRLKCNIEIQRGEYVIMLGRVYVMDEWDLDIVGVIYKKGDRMYGIHKLIMPDQSLLDKRLVTT